MGHLWCSKTSIGQVMGYGVVRSMEFPGAEKSGVFCGTSWIILISLYPSTVQ